MNSSLAPATTCLSTDGERTRPRETQLARIPLRANSLAIALVKPYALARHVEVTTARLSPTRPESPAMVTMAPPPASTMSGTTALVTWSMPSTVTST